VVRISRWRGKLIERPPERGGRSRRRIPSPAVEITVGEWQPTGRSFSSPAPVLAQRQQDSEAATARDRVARAEPVRVELARAHLLNGRMGCAGSAAARLDARTASTAHKLFTDSAWKRIA